MAQGMRAGVYPAKAGIFLTKLRRDKHLILMFLPAFLYYLIFAYLPIPGIFIAFTDFMPGARLFSGEFVGLKWFERFFSSIYAYRIIRNTFLLSLYGLLFGFPVPILFALCVCEIRGKHMKRIVQTISYLPHFFSIVAVIGLLKNLLSYNGGFVNHLVELLGGKRIDYFGKSEYFRALYVGSGIWQNFGFSAIIYMSAIVGVSPELYESARMDGINKFQEMWYITLPMIRDTIVILLLLNIGRLMSVGFEKVYLMYSSGIYETSDVISTFVYRQGIDSLNYSYSTAVGLFNSVINFLLVVAANQLCRRYTGASMW